MEKMWKKRVDTEERIRKEGWRARVREVRKTDEIERVQERH